MWLRRTIKKYEFKSWHFSIEFWQLTITRLWRTCLPVYFSRFNKGVIFSNRHPPMYPILERRSNVLLHLLLLLLLLLCQAQGTPPGFWNGVDWRALVESCPSNIRKLRGPHFFSLFFVDFFLQKKSLKKVFFWDFSRFSYFWNRLDWRALVESRPPHIGKLRG